MMMMMSELAAYGVEDVIVNDSPLHSRVVMLWELQVPAQKDLFLKDEQTQQSAPEHLETTG